MSNPWMWLLWALALIVVLFVGSAVAVTVVEQWRNIPPRRTQRSDR